VIIKIQQHLDRGEMVLGLMLDLCKAFDSIDHGILQLKLEKIGVRGHSLNWFYIF